MFTIVARLIFIVNKFFNTDRLFSYAELKLFWCVAASFWGGILARLFSSKSSPRRRAQRATAYSPGIFPNAAVAVNDVGAARHRVLFMQQDSGHYTPE